LELKARVVDVIDVEEKKNQKEEKKLQKEEKKYQKEEKKYQKEEKKNQKEEKRGRYNLKIFNEMVRILWRQTWINNASR